MDQSRLALLALLSYHRQCADSKHGHRGRLGYGLEIVSDEVESSDVGVSNRLDYTEIDRGIHDSNVGARQFVRFPVARLPSIASRRKSRRHSPAIYGI